jgi:hypothetical protein
MEAENEAERALKKKRGLGLVHEGEQERVWMR